MPPEEERNGHHGPRVALMRRESSEQEVIIAASNGIATSIMSHHGNGDSPSSAEDDGDFDADRLWILSPDAARALYAYQYKGEDRSLLYKYVYSPLSNYFVYQWTPRSVAANTITVAALACWVVIYGIMWYYSPNLDPADRVPPWAFAALAVSIVIYQILDNMDGKQARRTGTSSPLGLMFDHGCDAMNSAFGSALMMTVLGLHPADDASFCFATFAGPYALFYFGTWEEYHTGALIMPVFNGPNEGLLTGAVLAVISWAHGPEFWGEPVRWIEPVLSAALPRQVLSWILPERKPWCRRDVILLLSVVKFLQETTSKTFDVARKCGWRSIAGLFPFLASMACFAIVGWIEPALFLEWPRMTIHLTSALFVEMSTELMAAHMTRQPFRWLRPCLIPLFLITAAAASTGGGDNNDWLVACWPMYSVAACVFVFAKLYMVVQDFCHVLNIWCFDIVTPRPKQKANSVNNTRPRRKAEHRSKTG
jgi:ethanolaminephosphotransferase